MSEKLLVVSAVFLLVGSIGVGVAFAAPADHARVSVSERGAVQGDGGDVVAYAELPNADQVTFRKALSGDGDVSVGVSDVSSLRGVDAVTLDGVVYDVSVETGFRAVWEIVSAGIGFLSLFVGVVLGDEALKEVDEELRDVLIGGVVVVFAVGLLVVSVFGVVSGVGSTETSISVQPVAVSESSVNDGEVVSVSAFTGADREAVYEAVRGGEAVPPGEASFTVVEELGKDVGAEYGYVQSNSELYELRTVPGYRWFVEVAAAGVMGVFAVLIGVIGAVYAYDTEYVGGRIESMSG